MTVGELKTLLAALPDDMEITTLDKEHQVPHDITQVSRGRWTNDDDEFVQDDEDGPIAVIVPW